MKIGKKNENIRDKRRILINKSEIKKIDGKNILRA